PAARRTRCGYHRRRAAARRSPPSSWPPEGDALLELERDVLGHQLRVELGMDDLLDVEVDLLPGAHLQLVLQLLDLRALAADDDAGAGRRDGDARAIG